MDFPFLLRAMVIFGLCNLVAAVRSPFDYEAVLIIVIIELVFAFSVGFTCIIFSYNLFRALSQSEALSHDVLPSSNVLSNVKPDFKPVPTQPPNSNGAYSTFVPDVHPPHGLEEEEDEEMDIESKTGPEEKGLIAALRPFTSYLRLW